MCSDTCVSRHVFRHAHTHTPRRVLPPAGRLSRDGPTSDRPQHDRSGPSHCYVGPTELANLPPLPARQPACPAARGRVGAWARGRVGECVCVVVVVVGRGGQREVLDILAVRVLGADVFRGLARKLGRRHAGVVHRNPLAHLFPSKHELIFNMDQ